MSACPPAPNYARARGISDCNYEQFTPFERSRLREATKPHSPSEHPRAYAIGAYKMQDHQRVAGLMRSSRRNPSALGRSVLFADQSGNAPGGHFTLSRIGNNNRINLEATNTRIIGYSGPNDPNFIKDLWSSQVYSLWLTNGRAYTAQFPAMQNIVTNRGHNPDNLGPVTSGDQGRAIENLVPLLGTNVRGPDGIWGPASVSVVVDFLNTRGEKIFQRNLPANVRQVFQRLADGVSNPEIDRAKSAPTGESAPGATATPCCMLAAGPRASDPRCASADCGPGRVDDGGAPPAPPAPPADQFAGGDSTLLYVGIGLGVLALGVGTAVVIKKRKNRNRI